MKETWDDSKNGKISHALGLEELKLLKLPNYPKHSTGLMQYLLRCSWYSHRTRMNNPNIHVEPQKSPNCQSNLEKKQQS